MRILLCFSTTGQVREKNRVVDMPRCPKTGEFLETGEQTWFVERVVSTPEEPEQDMILHLRLSLAIKGLASRLREGARLVLQVEDDDGDEFFVRRAIEKSKSRLEVIRVTDGQWAMAYLKGEGEFSNRERFPLPAAVLLDLKMPRVTGYEVLEWIRGNEQFRGLPVIVLTSSTLYKDKERVTALGATAFMMKTVAMEDVPARVLEVLDPLAQPRADSMESQTGQ